MLILGARAVLAAAKNKTDNLSRWALALEERQGYWKAVVATAAQHALVDSQVVRYLRDHRARLTAQPPASRMNLSVKHHSYSPWLSPVYIRSSDVSGKPEKAHADACS